MADSSSIEAEIRNHGFSEQDHSRAWLGFWVSIWAGTIGAGATAGLIIGGLYSMFANDPWTIGKALYLTVAFSALGFFWSAIVGLIVLTFVALCTWLFRYHRNPLELAGIVGGLTAVFCMPMFIPVTVPIGIFGAWFVAKLYLRSDTALPMVLFNQLREERRLKMFDRW